MQQDRIDRPLSPSLSGRVRYMGGEAVKSIFTRPVGKSAWIAVTVTVTVLLVVVVLIAHTWSAIGSVAISTAGWVAISFGSLVTLLLGIGLMSLVFISNREGLDEAASVTRVAAQRAPPRPGGTPAGAVTRVDGSRRNQVWRIAAPKR